MLLTVTLNLALDVTYEVPRVEWHGANRVAAVHARAGGKGVNVARVLRALGHDAVVCGFVGGPDGAAASCELRRSGLRDALVAIAGETRRTVVVVDRECGAATGFWEPGPEVAEGEWRRFLDVYDGLLGQSEVVVLAGSLPSGLPADAYATLSRRARERGVPAVLDADDEALRRGLRGRPAVVKPNAEELARAVPGADIVGAAAALRQAGAEAVVASAGCDGLVAVTPDGRWRARPPEAVTGNATGAGDAAVAALAAGLVARRSWPERLIDAVAVSAAAVHAPVAGAFDPSAFARYRQQIEVEDLDGGGLEPDGAQPCR